MDTAGSLTISLDLLVQLGACAEARLAFERRFGKDAKVVARDVFVAGAELKRHDWLSWLQSKLIGFVDAVGNVTHGDYKAVVSGGVIVETGIVFASGSATVRAYDSATVEAYDSATVLILAWALHVTATIKSTAACAVDRRPDGKPRLILMSQDGEVVGERELTTTAE